MKLAWSLLQDETGAVLSAEAALLGTVGVLGAVVGVNLFAESVNDEMRDVAYAFRSLDQSYSVSGHSSPTAWTAGSGFTQEPVDKSLARLRARDEELRHREEKDERRTESEGRRDRKERDRGDDRNRDGDRDRGDE